MCVYVYMAYCKGYYMCYICIHIIHETYISTYVKYAYVLTCIGCMHFLFVCILKADPPLRHLYQLPKSLANITRGDKQ